MSLEIDFGALQVGSEIRRSATGSPLVGLLDGRWEAWLDDMLEEIEHHGELRGIEFVRVAEDIEPLPTGETRVTGILRVVSIDQDIPDQQASLFGVIVLLGVLLAGAWVWNVRGVRDDTVEIAHVIFGAAPSVAASMVFVALFAFLSIVFLRLPRGGKVLPT